MTVHKTAHETYVTINACKTRLMRAGAGPAVIFLHGASGAGQWQPFMQALAEHYDLIVPEHPGFGASDTPEWLDNIGDLAYFYLDFLTALDLQDVHLIGASLGGWVAAELATRNSSRLKSLTLVAPAGIHLKGVPKGDIFLWTAEQTAQNLFHDQSYAQQQLAQLAELDQEQQLTALKNRISTAQLCWQPRLYNPHLAKWLHRITTPTLLLWGAEDKVMPAAYGPAWQTLISGAGLKTFEQCGHLPHIEQPVQFAGAVREFIAGVGQ